MVTCSTLMDFESPKIRILSPEPGSQVFGIVHIQIEAKDNKKIDHIELILDGLKVLSVKSGSLTYDWDLTATNQDASYTILAKAFDPGGNWSEAKVEFFGYGKKPSPPELSEPADANVSNNTKPVMKWTAVSNAQGYHLQVGDSLFAKLAVNDSTIAVNQYASGASVPDATYFWKVRSRYNEGNWSEWSDTWKFTVMTQGPPAPSLILPQNGSSSKDNTPSFDWSDVGEAVRYEIQVSSSIGFSSYAYHDSLAGSNYSGAALLPDGIYYWRVRGKDDLENWGPWSATWSFSISTQGPSAPALLLPTNGSSSKDNTPSFDWSDVGEAVRYELQVSSSIGFSSYAYHDSLAGSNYSGAASLSDGIYYWRVRGKDDLENWGPWSATWSFSISTQGPSAPALLLPANGSSSKDNTPSFDWSDVGSAVKYELQISKSSVFSSYSDNDSLTISTFTGTSSLPDGTYYWRVRCKDNLDNWGSWSATWSFSISTQGPSAPSLYLPANDSFSNDKTPSFDLADVSGAVKFELQVSGSNEFGSLVYHDSLTGSAFDGTPSILDGTYYWRVRSKDDLGNWGLWSAVWTFTLDTEGPPAPALGLPANGSSTNEDTLFFDWADVGEAIQYEIQVSRSSGFENYVYHDSLAASHYSGTAALFDGTYFWRVRCKDHSGNWGSWTATWTFSISTQGPTAPDLIFPADGSSTNEVMPSFDWTDVAGAALYEFQASSSSGFVDVAYHDSSVVSHYSGAVPLLDGIHYWRVRGKDNLGNWGFWSAVWNFTIDTQGPPAPVLSLPANGSSTNVDMPSFDWLDVNGAVKYELQISSSAGFESFASNDTLTLSSYALTTSVLDGTYYWRVRGMDHLGNWSAWSEIWEFTVITQGPPAPALIGPPNAISTNVSTPSFDWTDVGGAVQYELQVSNSSGFESFVILQMSLTSSTYSAAASLSDSTFFWHVRGRDVVGNWSEWSETWSFKVDTRGPAAPSLSSPSNGSSASDNTPAFDWSDVPGASFYELQLDSNSGFEHPILDEATLENSDYSLPSTFSDCTYYWRVRAGNVLGNWSGWSEIWSLTIDTQGPDAPMLSSPVNASSQNDNTPSFDWSDVSDASLFELQVDNNSNFESPLVNQANLTMSDYTSISSFSDGTYYWHVRGRDSLENWGDWSETWSVTIDTQGPSAPSLSSPANSSFTLDSTPTFDWGNVSDAHTYELQVDNDSGFGSLAINQKNLTGSNYTATSALSFGTYYWRVRSKDVLGNTGAWSSTWSIYVFETGTLTDVDGNNYITVKIGTQWWMAENLKVTRYRNGVSIPNVTSAATWSTRTTGAYCDYDNNSSNVTIYGRLYNLYAIHDDRILAPAGWHVPTDNEWKTLEKYLGMSQAQADGTTWRGTNEGGKIKETGTLHWSSPNTGATNESGFTAIAGGYRAVDGVFCYLKDYAIFWTSTSYSAGKAWERTLHCGYSSISRVTNSKVYGFSVRCVKN